MILNEYLDYLNELRPGLVVAGAMGAPIAAVGTLLAIQRHKLNKILKNDPEFSKCKKRCEDSFTKRSIELAKKYKIAPDNEKQSILNIGLKNQKERDVCFNNCIKISVKKSGVRI